MQALAATGARTGVTAIEARKQVLGSIYFTSTIQRLTIGCDRDGLSGCKRHRRHGTRSPPIAVTSLCPRNGADTRPPAISGASSWRRSPSCPAARRARRRLRAVASRRATAYMPSDWPHPASWRPAAAAACRRTRTARLHTRSGHSHPGTCKPARARPTSRRQRFQSLRHQGPCDSTRLRPSRFARYNAPSARANVCMIGSPG